jgi:hypothetical protein
MSHQKPKRYEMWMEGENPCPPEISRLLPKLILELALREDMTGPCASGVVQDKYISELTSRLKEPVTRELREAGIEVSSEELAKISQVSASETFVIRRLNEARLEGEVKVQDFNHLPFYRTYQDYFEQSPEIVAKAFGIVVNAVVSDSAARRDPNKN